MSRATLLTLVALLAASTLAGCNTTPRTTSAAVLAACPALEAMPGVPAAELYRACREALLQEGQPQPLNTRMCPPRPSTPAGAMGPWAEVCR